MNKTLEYDFEILKAEIAENAGLILKVFPYIPPPEPEPETRTTISYTSNRSENDESSRLLKILKRLKHETVLLKKKIEGLQSERQNLLREKSILIKEIKRLRGETDKIAPLNRKIEELEEKLRVNENNIEIHIKEKNNLNQKYDETVKEVSLQKQHFAESQKKYSQLYSNFTVLEIEKANLQVDLNKAKHTFKSKLIEKTKQIELDFDKKVGYLRKQKDRVSNFNTEVMDDSDTPAWMVTYGDMVTLLLTFFILYYSIAAQNLLKFKDVIFGDVRNNIGLIELMDTMEIKTSLNEWTGFQKNSLLSDIEKVSSDQIKLNSGQNKSRIVVRIPGSTLFKPGSADLDKAGWPSLTEIANIFKKYPTYKVNIQGHTDDISIDSEKFPTNWELSAVRATAVLRFLNDKGIDPTLMTATGYADTFPLGPNTTPEERSKNRRVEFVLEKIK